MVATYSWSPVNSLDVSSTADILHEFAGMTSGTWYARVRTYVPSTQTGDLYVILLNRYDGFCAAAGDFDNAGVVRLAVSEGPYGTLVEEVKATALAGNTLTLEPFAPLTNTYDAPMVGIVHQMRSAVKANFSATPKRWAMPTPRRQRGIVE